MSIAGNQFAQLANTVTVSATDSSGSTANQLSHPLVDNGGGGGTVLVTNLGTNKAFFKFGNSSVSVTTTTGIPILSGASRVFSLGPKSDYVAAVCASTETATVYFTPGRGR